MTTTFHCDKLCGNECCAWLRARLIAAKLRDEGIDVDGNAAYRRKLLLERGRDAAQIEASVAKCAIVDAMILDPTKLAELMASALRERGFSDVAPFVDELAPVDEFRISVHGDDISIVFRRCGAHKRACTLASAAKARALLLAIMQTTADESSRKTCESIIRGDP